MDDYLALSLIIMGIAIGALLVIWGAMSLAFFLRKKHRAKKIQERIAERKAADESNAIAKPQKQNTALNSSRKNRIPRMITEKAARIWAAFLYCEASRLFFFLGVVCVHKLNYFFL